jgi:hypothetical protein
MVKKYMDLYFQLQSVNETNDSLINVTWDVHQLIQDRTYSNKQVPSVYV